MSLRTTLIQNAKAYNNTLTEDFFESKTNRGLLAFIHPQERGEFLRLINKSEGLE